MEPHSKEVPGWAKAYLWNFLPLAPPLHLLSLPIESEYWRQVHHRSSYRLSEQKQVSLKWSETRPCELRSYYKYIDLCQAFYKDQSKRPHLLDLDKPFTRLPARAFS